MRGEGRGERRREIGETGETGERRERREREDREGKGEEGIILVPNSWRVMQRRKFITYVVRW